ncbi:MAG: trypsin-like peptidase domain-containing protein [Thermoplasmatota archaeon]
MTTRFGLPAAALLALTALSGCLDTLEEVGDDIGDTITGGGGSDAAFEAPPWPAVDAATVRPGVQMISEGGQCTSNFVFTSPDNRTLYLGFAAHCVGEGESTDTNGCDTPSLPLGSAIEIQGASQPAELVYSSWQTMEDVGETDGAACSYNDFAVVALHPDDRGMVHPAMFHFGGPTELAPSVEVGETVLTFGNTGLRPGPEELDRRQGLVVANGGDGWTHTVYTATPGLPGDSGSGVLTGDGRALGVLVTLGIAPLAGSNGVTNLLKAMDYAQENAGLQLQLATWEQFSGNALGAPDLIGLPIEPAVPSSVLP